METHLVFSNDVLYSSMAPQGGLISVFDGFWFQLTSSLVPLLFSNVFLPFFFHLSCNIFFLLSIVCIKK